MHILSCVNVSGSESSTGLLLRRLLKLCSFLFRSRGHRHRHQGGQQAHLRADCQEGRREEHQDGQGVLGPGGDPDHGGPRNRRRLRPEIQEAGVNATPQELRRN